ncbi:MAG: N-acetylglucosamine-6-phosphate deacetylase [Acidobacteria bacterium]|nr:N-acetylglucosamine-6-phosphate deacetylase [Acidobacteriota bacterium]
MSVTRTFLSGADVVLPDRVALGLTVVMEGDRIVDLTSGPRELSNSERRVDATGQLVVPGFVDVHVHGVMGIDVLDGADAVSAVARELSRFGVTAFCPTSIACSPDTLSAFLDSVAAARSAPEPGAARVLRAHLESNFINPEYNGAQPAEWLWTYEDATKRPLRSFFSPDVGILTMAPEMPGGMDLLRAAVQAGIRVSLGHSGATFDQAREAIDAGARHATHLFNRMSPMDHRDPGLVGAVLSSDEVAAELICDGHHVHPAVMRVAIAAKGHSRVMAITDGTSGSGLPRGTCARLGGRNITVGDVARLDDGTLAGSVATMDRVFATLVAQAGQSLVEAALLCSTTPARELGLIGQGVIAPGRLADLAILTPDLRVVQTWVGGRTSHPVRP